MTSSLPQLPPRDIGRRRFWALMLAGTCLPVVVAVGIYLLLSRASNPPPAPPSPLTIPRRLDAGQQLTVWWDVVPKTVRTHAVASGDDSNVRPQDYIGPAACKECHKRNYESWSQHPHHWMNALADTSTVKGDFSGKASIAYLGGKGTFYRQAGKYFMRLERGPVSRLYEIHQTIGSRFFQYYVGKQIEGPEPPGHPFSGQDHVLAFGYWLSQKEWVPVIHIGPEKADGARADPFDPPGQGIYYAAYAASCNYCHTTFPLGDLFGRRTHQIGEYAPVPLHWSMRGYLEEAHPDALQPMAALLKAPGAVDNPMRGWGATRYAVTLGVSCEACHLGARRHVESRGKIPPKFFPASPHLLVEADQARLNFGRTHDNVNWACGRCHLGSRPQFAAGMSTWNSVEYADAMRGSCYSKLRCVDCHNPHRATGPRWSASADHDDALCLRCHEKFAADPQRLAHTHHRPGSDGARCMNCHMPRINEGIEDVVRTHMIYSPTRADMIEANQPNACNLCHADRPIDWTLRYLKDWYKADFDEAQVALHYRDRALPVAQGWLKSDNAAVRLVSVEALARSKNVKALPELLEALDDPYLVNRQFAYKGLQEMLGLRLSDFGYRFYQSAPERRAPLAALRARLLPTPSPGP
jgi:predicted CXXCH cytochrome family protein